MHRMTISTKITLISCIILFACLISGGGVLIRFEDGLVRRFMQNNMKSIEGFIDQRFAEEQEQLVRSLKQQARMISIASAGYIIPLDRGRLSDILAIHVKSPLVTAIRVVDQDGAPLIAAWKDGNTIIDRELPETFSPYDKEKVSADVISLDDTVASVTIYYSDRYLKQNLDAFRKKAEAIAHRKHSKLLDSYKRAIFMQSLGIIALIIILTISIALLLQMMIFRPLGVITKITNRLAEYDLGIVVANSADDEIGRLLQAVDHMVERLKEIITSASTVAVQVSDASLNISGAVDQQVSVAHQQSGLVSDISRNMAALSTSSEEIADHANSVAGLAQDAYQRSFDGSEALAGLVHRMEAIDASNQQHIQEIRSLNERAGEIARISDLINTIADQTRMIAFNAALEASSAGEAGKRFGVVAAEVRRLADSVTASTFEIDHMMDEIGSATDDMVLASEKEAEEIHDALVQCAATRELLTEVVSASEATTQSIHRISTSTQHQKISTNEVAGTLEEIARGAEQSSEAISRISEISSDIAKISQSLKDLMAQFNLVATDDVY